jgi:spermidine/putrescine-binding protein
MVIDSYGWRQVAEVGEDRMAFVLPEAVTVVNPDGIGVLKGAPNRDLAEKFVEFVLSEPGQKLWILKAGAPGGPREFELARLPVIPGLAARFGKDAAVSFDPYEWKPGFTYDSEKGSVRWGALNDLIGAAIIDTHEELVSAWREVKDLPADHPLMAQFARAPLSEQDLLEMAGKKWNDPAFRGATRAQWARDAMERCRRIARRE